MCDNRLSGATSVVEDKNYPGRLCWGLSDGPKRAAVLLWIICPEMVGISRWIPGGLLKSKRHRVTADFHGTFRSALNNCSPNELLGRRSLGGHNGINCKSVLFCFILRTFLPRMQV